MATETAVTTGLATFHSWVGGRPDEGRAGLRPATNPATGEAFAQASLLDASQAAEAVAAAQVAFPAWSRTTFRERARLLDRLRQAMVDEADDVARLIEREQGKPFAAAFVADILPSLDALAHLSAHAEELLRDDALAAQQLLPAHKQARLVYEPIGVILAIKPWNYPWAQSLPVVGSALMAGNTVVLKPAPATPIVPTAADVRVPADPSAAAFFFAAAALAPGVRIEARQVSWLESAMDQWSEQLPPLANFILPGGTSGAAHLHLARTVCRRAERQLVALARQESVGSQTLPYLNRLSDALFVLARAVNRLAGENDVLWDSRT